MINTTTLLRNRNRQTAVTAILGIVASLYANGGMTADQFDFRHPRPEDYPGENVAGKTELQFVALSKDRLTEYNVVASFSRDEIEPFEVREVRVNG